MAQHVLTNAERRRLRHQLSEERAEARRAARRRRERERAQREGETVTDQPDDGNGKAGLVIIRPAVPAERPGWIDEVLVVIDISRVSVGMVVYLDPKRIKRDENQPRTEFEPGSIEGLAERIYHEGQKEPIHVYRICGDPKHDWCVENGERRWRACLLKDVPVWALIIAEPTTELRKHLDQIGNNEDRAPLSPMDEARAISKAFKLGASMETVCRHFGGKSRLWVEQRLTLLDLHLKVQQLLSLETPEDKRLNIGIALELAKLTPVDQLKMLSDVERLPTRKARALIRQHQGKDCPTADDAKAYRAPVDDFRVAHGFAQRTADDAAEFAGYTQAQIERMFAHREAADRIIVAAQLKRAINNLRVFLEKVAAGIE